MHSFRHFIRLLELQDTKTGGVPPTALGDMPGRREPESGRYWFRDEQKIAATAESHHTVDFAIQPMLLYRQFGFQPDAIQNWFQQNNKVAYDEMVRYLKDPSQGIWGSLGMRSGSIAYATQQGWAYIEFDEHRATIWLAENQARRVVNAAGSMFPLMGMETIKLILPQGSDAFKNHQIRFEREDHPGFAGAYGALLQWARHGTVPQQSWYYVSLSEPIGPAGLQAQPKAVVYDGRRAVRNMYAIPYIWGSFGQAPRQRTGSTMYRFSPQVALDLGLHHADMGDAAEPMLYRKEPFGIPATAFQRKTVAGWQPL